MNCARCGRRFFLHSPINALWCDHDQFFICRRCAIGGGRHHPMRCPHCNNRVGSSVPSVMIVAVMLLLMCLLTGPIAYSGATYRQSLADTPQAQISGVAAGETVMIYGTIATNAHAPTLTGYWVQAGKSGYWDWTDYAFVLDQGSLTIGVAVSHLGGAVFGGARETNSNEWYEPGDAIAVIGTVSGSNGSWQLNAQEAAPSPAAFSDPFDVGLWEASAVGGAFAGALLVVGWVIGIRRFKAHEARERQPGMYDYRPPTAPSPPADSGVLPP